MKTDQAFRTPSKGGENFLAAIALRFAAWSERWFPDAFVFAAIAVVVVAIAAMLNGAPFRQVARAFGDGFWSLIPFTLQQVMVVVSGYIIASSPPAARLIDWIAGQPRNGRGAIAFIAVVTMSLSLINWALSLVFGGLLARAVARRTDLAVDYRAAGAAAYLGLGATWALGLSSSAAQLQANLAAIPKPLLQITGVIPFAQTIFLWQSGVMLAVLMTVSTLIAYLSAPSGARAVTAAMMGVDVETRLAPLPPRERPGEWLEYSPLLTLLLVALARAGICEQGSNPRDLQSQHLQFPAAHAGPAVALAPEKLPQRRDEGGPGDRRHIDAVPALWRHHDDPDGRRRRGRAYARASPRAVFRQHQHEGIIPRRDGRLFSRARVLHPVGRRQMGA
jgi:short-chain fatty acids transporter